MILPVSGQRELLYANHVLSRPIQLRNPYVDPMSLIQSSSYAASIAVRNLPSSEYSLGATINGIAAGLHNIG